MALQISEKKGLFYLKGKLNNLTSRFFIIYFEYNIEQSKNVTINIDNLDEISRDGLEAINTLTAIALRNHKIFSVIGETYNDSNQMNVA